MDASSSAVVRDQLHKQGLYPTLITHATQEAKLTWYQRLFMRKVSLKDKILFTKQLSVLLKSGVPLLQALDLLIDQFDGRLHMILIDVKDNVKGGESLADSLSEYPKVFDTIYVQLVKAGEASGKLDEILMRLTEYLERRDAIKRKVRGAMQYPIIQMVIAVAVVIILLTAVVPQLQGLFEAQGENLPTTTKIMLAISDVLQNYFVFVAILFIICALAFGYFKRTAFGRRFIDSLKLRIPIIKYVAKTNAIVQFCYTLGMLIESGVNLSESMDIVVKIIDNQLLADTLKQARDKIIKQGKIAQYLKQTNIFPPIAIYLIQTGEETGQLGSMLLTVAQNYEVELGELIDSATGMISPIMLIFMAVVVGFIIMAIASPIMQGGQSFGVEGI